MKSPRFKTSKVSASAPLSRLRAIKQNDAPETESILAVSAERSDQKTLRKYARFELLVIDERLTEDAGDVAVRFLSELIERHCLSRSTVLCTQYSPSERHEHLGGGVQADAMRDRLVHGSARTGIGEVDVRKLLSEKKRGQ